jgi:DnaA family protein
MIGQVPLALGRKDGLAFESYLPGPNSEIVSYLRRLSGGRCDAPVYLYGEPASGKTHLLQAVCQAASDRGQAAIYLPMGLAAEFPYEMLDGIERVGVVCIDDIQKIAGRREWEMAILKLLDRIEDTRGILVVAGATIPAELGLERSQLAARLGGGLEFRLAGLTAAERHDALALRASRRGFELPPEAGRYLLRHHGASMATLMEALDIVDKASIAAQRKLTVPFVRRVLAQSDTPVDKQ